VEAEVYSHQSPVSIKPVSWGNFYGSKNITPVDKGQGNVATVLVRDGSGKTYPAQVVWAKETPPGITSKVQFVVDDFPAGGYKTFYVDTDKTGEYNTPIPFKDNTFETDYFKIKVDMSTGAIVSLVDKRSQTEYVKEGKRLNTLHISLEDKKGGMKSWVINKTISEYDVTDVRSVKIAENGPVRACIETEKVWGKSKFIERTYIYRSYPRIDYDMEVHWLETGTPSEDSPMLRAIFPLALQDARFYTRVPFDIIERPADNMLGGQPVPEALQHRNDYGLSAETKDGQEVPAQQWVDVNNGKTGIALLNKTKYGHSYHRGELKITLMRSAGDPDIYPNLGKFNISYALYPHAGDWKSQVWQEGENFNVPVVAAEPPSLALAKNHATRPEEASFIAVAPANVSLSGMKQSEEGDELIIRLVEIEGKETTATVELPLAAKTVRKLNILEFPVKDEPSPALNGKRVTVKLKPNEIVTLGIK
jgi:alpha-mannosidase